MDLNLEALTVQLIEKYYANDRRLFFEYMDDDIIWIGPAIRQYIEGKQNLLNAFAQESHSLQFRTAQMSSRIVTGSRSSCEVLAHFLVYTYYPSGHISMHHQRVTLFWKKHKTERFPQWRYAVIHISNGMEVDERDTIYPTHFDEFERKHLLNHFETLQKEMDANRLVVRGTDSSTYYIRHEDLLYVCGGKGKFCDIYTQNGTIRVRLLIEQIRKMLPEQFYRPHRSYLVNVLKIQNLSRYEIQMQDGTVIPVPPKKYAQVSEDIETIMADSIQNSPSKPIEQPGK